MRILPNNLEKHLHPKHIHAHTTYKIASYSQRRMQRWLRRNRVESWTHCKCSRTVLKALGLCCNLALHASRIVSEWTYRPVVAYKIVMAVVVVVAVAFHLLTNSDKGTRRLHVSISNKDTGRHDTTVKFCTETIRPQLGDLPHFQLLVPSGIGVWDHRITCEYASCGCIALASLVDTDQSVPGLCQQDSVVSVPAY